MAQSVETESKISAGFVERNEEVKQRKSKGSLILYLSAFAATSVLFGDGGCMVWTSPAVNRLKSNDTSINPLGTPATTLQISQIAALPLLGNVFGPLIFAKPSDIIGRKKTIMFVSAIMLTFNLVLAFATNIYFYYLARFMLGIGGGGALSTVAVFLSEIAEDHNRGKFGCFIGLTYPLGNLFVYAIGPMFPIKVYTLLDSFPYVVNILSFLLFVPESPAFLARQGRKEDAIKSLEKLRNNSPSDIEKEYEKIVNSLESRREKPGSTFKYVMKIFRTRTYRKGFFIGFGCIAVQHFSGVTAIMAFAAPLFDEIKAGISGKVVARIIGCIKFCGMLLAMNIVERAGRRPLLLFSSLASSMCLFVVGLFFYLQASKHPIVSSILWLPILAIFLYFIVYSTGLGIVPMAMMSELFPSDVKSVAVSLVTVGIGLSAMFVVSLFPIVKEMLSPTWCLWFFSGCTSLGFMFIFFMVPEVKGKSIQEIQEMLSK